ncbi:hypothetical protein [Caballeronia sp. LZ001]|uniref:hypothetical protein n=1 Tax=Caballeronia sp. LZ001 TaxID=3038553 RepID=UPI002855C89E|nr:hypothetical protein [Caballeronia sp. LZ001]MDR5803660.1 hypothetical protein [Caballeronia sp. LZ001]
MPGALSGWRGLLRWHSVNDSRSFQRFPGLLVSIGAHVAWRSWLAAEAGYLSAGWFFDAVAPDSIASLLTPLALAKAR